MAGLWLQPPALASAASPVLAWKDGPGRENCIAFTLEREKGCADPPALLQEAVNIEKST
jgi:hypothetical protein